MITTYRQQIPAAKHPTTHAPPRPGRSRSTDAPDSCPAASPAGTVTAAPPGDTATPRPAKAKPAAEGTAAETAKNGAPGFTAAFVIAGMLAVAYAMMRRRA